MGTKGRLPFVQSKKLASGEMRFRGWAVVVEHHPDGDRKERIWSSWFDSEEAAYDAAMVLRGGPLKHACTLDQACEILLEECRAKEKRPDTLSWYAGHLDAVRKKVPGSTYLHDITPQTLEKFVRDRQRDWAKEPVVDESGKVLEEGRRVKAATINADLRALYRVFAIAIRKDFCSENPVKLVDRPKAETPAMDWFTMDEFADLLQHVTDERHRDLFAMLALSGTRLSEAARLRTEHIRLQVQQIRIPDEVAKTKQRIVPINAELAEVLERILARSTNGKLFPTKGFIEKAFRDWKRQLNEPRLHPHAMRHTFGMGLVRAEIPVPVVQQLMGHKAIATTMKYVHEHAADGAAAVQRLSLRPSGDRSTQA